MNWPVVKNDKPAAQRITLLHVTLATLGVWLLPLLAGALLYGLALFLPIGDASSGGLVGRAVLLISMPMFSWPFLVAGGLVLFGMIRAGWGGLLPALATGFLLGWGFPALAAGASASSLFPIAGIAHAALVWLALKLRHPADLTG